MYWIYFGLPVLDACLKPLDTRAEDWNNIIAGPPGGGKSSFMRHIALHNLARGKRVAVFLLETGLRWVDAGAATMARVNLRHVENGEALPDMVKRYEAAHRALQEMAGVNLFLFEDLFFVEDIERQVREIDRTLRAQDVARGVPADKARGLDLVIVDYLQITGTRQNFRGNREQVVAHVSMSFKKLFKSLDVAGLVGAQINRAAREDAAKAPRTSALRESGSIEQDADRVIFVHTPPTNKADITQDGNVATDEVEIVQRKCRNGAGDIGVGVLFHKMQTRYEEPPCEGRVARPALPKPEGGYGRK
jgi:replicative DNA helicase